VNRFTGERFLESREFPFYIMPYSIPPDWNNPHTHEFIECDYVAEGTGEHVYNGRAYPIARGDLFVIEPNVEHGYRVHGSSPLEVYNVLFLPSLLETELRHLAQVTPFVNFFYVEPLREPSDFKYHLKLNFNEGLETKLVLDRILKEFTKKRLSYRLSIKALLMELFIFLSRAFEGRISQPMSTAWNETTILERVCAFVRHQYAQPIMMDLSDVRHVPLQFHRQIQTIRRQNVYRVP
jgi:mannose-6-phosphate isomerase-like protein (cupin superfamily)